MKHQSVARGCSSVCTHAGAHGRSASRRSREGLRAAVQPGGARAHLVPRSPRVGAGGARWGGRRAGPGRCGGAGAVRRAAAGGIFVPFFIQQQFGVETCNRGKKSRVLGGIGEPCSQEPKKISGPPAATLTPTSTHTHTQHTRAHPRGTARLRAQPPDIERKGFVWRAISDRGRSIGLGGLSACRRREVAFDHFYCLPDGRI